MRIINEETLLVGVHSLKPHPKNPNQGDLGAVHESIETNGFFGSIVVQRSTNIILVGHHRLDGGEGGGSERDSRDLRGRGRPHGGEDPHRGQPHRAAGHRRREPPDRVARRPGEHGGSGRARATTATTSTRSSRTFRAIRNLGTARVSP